MELDHAVREFLSVIEDKEAKLLSWGYVDGGFSKQEITEMAEEWISEYQLDFSPDDFLDELWEKRMLLEIQSANNKVLYRTRMAETVRLMARLRQIFSFQKWKEAPTLVSDFRFLTRPRKYPKRDITVVSALEELSEVVDEQRLEAARQLLNRGEFLLSKFQVQAAKRMLEELNNASNRGMIVCSGTGTGKTLSFYLPALTEIASLIDTTEDWTKALALYPRNELLKDQFMETYREARRLDGNLLGRKARKLRIGAFFGPAPSSVSETDVIKVKWKKYTGQMNGYICPYMVCPDCENPMIWKNEDLSQKLERLTCMHCQKVIGNDEILLTRESMRKTLPDIVFTTTEMLNRTMSDIWYGKIIGLFTKNPPVMMLLDEVHTYEGVHGAQVALLIRRWRYAVNKPVHFTGLSATLEDAPGFFSQLTGLEVSQVDEISPSDEDMIPEGKEYQLILRGDPVAGTSLLSTTIQASMLLRRMLDKGKMPSNGMAGQKLFVFTDDLDVTNRLYYDLLDAEGLDYRGRPVKNKRPLSIIRRHSNSDPIPRLKAGQSWYYAEQIGHDLSQSAPVGRTSSQDVGVSANAEILVATASLEVGYNDPTVGAVIQHKAPLDLASFLQRKGRAGRNRLMRPWMVTVLSDYGRDRLVYQSYETLFDPVLEKRNLPVNNRYVLRMQAVNCLMDWIADEINRSFRSGSIWNDFSSPHQENSPSKKQRHEKEYEILSKLIDNLPYRNRFITYLERALKISREEVLSILWDPPRALMYSVIPTILRRLRMNWSVFGKRGEQENYKPTSPLPEFIPANLFSDLNLPEVTILLPETRYNRDENETMMGILQALNTFAPGRVTKRFGIHQSDESHWVAPPALESGSQDLNLAAFCPELEALGEYQIEKDGQVVNVSAFRPWRIQPVVPDLEVSTTSNSQLLWKSQLFPTFDYHSDHDQKNGLKLEIPRGTVWNKVLKEIKVYSHNLRSTVSVRRFAIGSSANIKVTENRIMEEIDTEITYIDDNGNQAALGYSQLVDGMVFRFHVPEGKIISTETTDAVTIRSFRTAYFRHLVATDERLNGMANSFQRERLSEVYLSAILSKAMGSELSLEETWKEWKKGNFIEGINDVLEVIFQGLAENEGASGQNQERNRQKLHNRILELGGQDVVIETMHDLAQVLWRDLDQDCQAWALERWKTTLGAALLLACKQMTGQFNGGDLLLDIGGGPRPELIDPEDVSNGEIWITESTSGGSGIIEEIARKYHEDPKRFFRLVESALDPSDAELIDIELSRCLHLMQTNQNLSGLFQNVRLSNNYQQTSNLLEKLNSSLIDSGVLLTHSVRNAIYNRILKPGSSSETDDLLRHIIQLWKQEEARLGVEIDGRVFAFMFSTNPSLVQQFRQALSHIDIQAVNDQYWRYQVIYGLLWPRGNQIRSKALEFYNPFAKNPPMERELLRQSINQDLSILITEDKWYEKLVESLKESAHVNLIAPVEYKQALKKAILQLSSQPIDIGYLHLYPRIEGMKRDTDSYIVTVDLREDL